MSMGYQEPEFPPEAGRKGGAVAAAPYGGQFARTEATALAFPGLSRASWPAIWAGFFLGMVVLMVLGMLGVALGIRWVTAGPFTPAEGLWAMLITLVSFFVGGWATGAASGLPGKATGAVNGLLFAAFSLVVLALLKVAIAGLFLPMLSSPTGGVLGQTLPGLGDADLRARVGWALVAVILALIAGVAGGMLGAPRGYPDTVIADRAAPGA
jgi:hypothetical protein